MEQFLETIIIISTAFSAIGVVFLIGLISKYHKARMDSLKMITFKSVNDELLAFECLVEKLNVKMKDKISSLEEYKNSNPNVNKISERLELLTGISTALNNFYYFENPNSPKYIRELISDIKKLHSDNPQSLKSIIQNYTYRLSENKKST
jgi:hypothetical protein